MEAPAASDDSARGACLERTSAALTVDDVYEIAKLVGAEVERLIDGFGKESAVALVPKIVKVLELLESFASRNHALKVREEELLKTFESLQLQQQQQQQQHKKRAAKDADDSADGDTTRELQQKEEQWRRKCEELQVQVQQLQDESQQLHSQLRGNHAHEDRVQRQEREVMLKLKEVVDKQRDELRAKVQEISSISKEVEALQEQLDRFMKMNAELRHKQSVLQAQLRSSVERKADMEADLKEKSKLIDNLHRQLHASNNSASQQSPLQPAAEPAAVAAAERQNAEQPCFTKKEVRDIIFERNELKTNLFLVQEELNYYQREILNEERCPGFLLEAVRSAITKRRRLIKAKMLGIIVNDCSSSDDEDKAPLSEDHTAQTDDNDKHAESRIRTLFGFLTRSGSGRSPTHSGSAHPSPAHMPNSVSSWEILGDGEEDGETEQPPSP